MAAPVVYADYLRRQYSTLIDAPIILALALGSDYLFTLSNINVELTLIPYVLFRIFVVMQIPGFLYIIFFWASGQTPGMKFAHIKLVNASMQPVGILRALWRYICQFFTGFIGFFAYTRMMSDPKKQAVYDKISDTYIIHTSDKKPSSIALFFAYALNACLFLGVYYLAMTIQRPPTYSLKDFNRIPFLTLMTGKKPFQIKLAAKANYDAGQMFLLQAQRLDPNEQKYLEKLYLSAQSARGEFKQALIHDPNNPRIHGALASAFSYLPSDAAKQGQYEAYKRAMELDPKNPLYVYGVGLSALRLDQGDEALSYLEKAIEIQPNYPEAYQTIGVYYDDAGDDARAREYYKKALILYQEDNTTDKNNAAIETLQKYISELEL